VLSSAYEVDQVLAGLRAAGLSPVAEDSSGVVIVETRDVQQASSGPAKSVTHTPAELAKQLADAPDDVDGSPTVELLTELNPNLVRRPEHRERLRGCVSWVLRMGEAAETFPGRWAFGRNLACAAC
jgi:hypothetical protein